MRIFSTLLLFLCLVGSAFAQSATTKARAAAGANFFSLLERTGAGTAYLTAEGATTAGNEITFSVDGSVYGELLGVYENYDHATATVVGDEITAITFPNGWVVPFTYSSGELTGIGDFPYVKWENDRPAFAATEWTPNNKLKGGDYVRTTVYIKYDGQGRYTEVSRYAEFAKGKSLDKLKPQKESQANLLLDYTYEGAAVTATAQFYKVKSRQWTASPRTPITYTINFGNPNQVSYKSAGGKLEKTFFYEEGKLVKDDMTSRLMGAVRTVTEYEYFRDWIIKSIAKKYASGKLSEITTDNWEVVATEPADGEEPEAPVREYAGGEVANASGKVIRERKLGHERRLNPDGTWTAWLARKNVGK